MKYIICDKPGQINLKTKNIPRLKKYYVLVEIRRVGICGTDLHAFKGDQPYFNYPRILGHELAGVVLKKNESKSSLKIGEKVVVIPYIECGDCDACKIKLFNCCEKINVIGVHSDGGLQEKIAVPAKNLISVNSLSFDEIALIEPLSIGYHALKRAKIKSADKILVIGCGPIGIGIISLALSFGCEVIATDYNLKRLEYVKNNFSKVKIIETNKNLKNDIQLTNKGSLVDKVFDATGNKIAIESSQYYVRHGGKLILVGIYKNNICFSHPDIHKKEIQIICSRNATKNDFKSIIKFLKKREFPSKSFITKKVSFDNLPSDFKSFYSKEKLLIKAMVEL